MSDRFVTFLLVSRWAAAIVATMYHVRFLLFVNYDAVHRKDIFSTGFYFLTGLGHESYAVFFILDGILAGFLLRRRSGAPDGRSAASLQALSLHAGSLYRILLPSLMIGAGLDLTGSQFFSHTGVYSDFPEFSALSLSLSALFGNLLMLHPFIVPNFGSNSMLYLSSYLFWTLVLLGVFVRAANIRQPRGRYLQALLFMAVAFVMPYQFLIWATIWLAGVAVVFLAEARLFRPPLLLALPLFGCTLVLSRLMGSRSGMLPEPFGDLVIQGGFWLVGLGFALTAWAMYPKQRPEQPASLASSAAGSAGGWSGQTASFTFFCHFPVIMLLAAIGSTLFEEILMQQPVGATYLRFAGFVAAAILTAAMAAWVATLAMNALAAKWGSRA